MLRPRHHPLEEALMIKKMCLAAVLLGILLLCLPVTAEMLNGTILYNTTISSTVTQGGSNSGTLYMHSVFVNNIEYSYGTRAFIHYDYQAGYRLTYPGGMALNGKSIPIIIRLTNVGGQVLCANATLGYQRLYNSVGTEINGFQYIEFNTSQWNAGILGLTGDKYLYLDYADATLGGAPYWNNGASMESDILPNGGMNFGAYMTSRDRGADGILQINKNYELINTYSLTKPAGLGITGQLTKAVNGINYPSKGLIYDGVTGALVASDTTVTNDYLPFNIPSSAVIVGVKASDGVFINSSVLFKPAVTNYTITVSPNSGTMAGVYSGILSPATGITAIRWYAYYPGQSAPADFYDATSTPSSQKNLNYALLAGSWMGWDTVNGGGFTNNKGATMPNPVTLIPRYSGAITVGCYVYLTDGTMQNPTATLTIWEGQGLQKITFLAEDALNGNKVSPSTFNIKKLSTATWSNASEIRPGQIDVQYPTGSALLIEVVPPTGSGFSTATASYQVIDTTGYTQSKAIPLWRNSSANVSMTTANLMAYKNSDFSPIKGASITLSDGQSCSTSAAGSCQFTLNNGTTTYTALVKATGYQTNQFYFLPTGASYSRVFMLVAIGATPTPYITVPVPTATVTGVPTGIVTLNPVNRQQNVQSAGDIWFSNAVGLSGLIFIAVIASIAQKIYGKRKK
jgi:hypothetical protein